MGLSGAEFASGGQPKFILGLLEINIIPIEKLSDYLAQTSCILMI